MSGSHRNGPHGTRDAATASELLAGPVERVTFHNPESGFCVLRVKARGHRDLVTIVGHAASAARWQTTSRTARHRAASLPRTGLIIAAERDEALVQTDRLLALLARLQRMQFEQKSERLPEDQLHFAFEEIAASIAAHDAEAEKQSRSDAPRAPTCCRGTMAVIGADISDRIDVSPRSTR
jgi:hypothetical protein